jgi:hypothetical protein
VIVVLSVTLLSEVAGSLVVADTVAVAETVAGRFGALTTKGDVLVAPAARRGSRQAR